MELHEKIRRMRLEAGMTQSELAGDMITRNMLSQIENGSATPSVRTLKYLADRLNTSASYFLSDHEEDFLFQKVKFIGTIRTYLKNKDYNTCIQLCSLFAGKEDDELNLILAECFFYAAIADFQAGKLLSAHNGFITSQKHASLTLYFTNSISFIASAYIDLIKTVNIKNDEMPVNASDSDPLRKIITIIPQCDILYYYRALIMTETDPCMDGMTAELFIKNISGFVYNKHITARFAIFNENRGEAFRLLRDLDHDDTPGAVRYHVLRDLERLAIQTGDFESGYNYSQKRLKLYNKMQK